MKTIYYIKTPSGKCIALNDENIILVVGDIFKIEDVARDADYMFTFINDAESKYRFTIDFTNGLCINMLYSSIESAIKDRDYIIGFLIDYYDEREQ